MAQNVVSAWDITVRNSDPKSLVDIDGRVFTYAWTVDTGGNNSNSDMSNRARRIATSVYYVSSDGYRYKQELRGVDPYRAAFYANSKGFLDTNGSPLYRDFRGNGTSVQNGASGNAGIKAQAPEYPIFFSDISPGGANAAEVNRVLTALSLPLTPSSPELSSPQFLGNVGGNQSTVSVGGLFTFDVVNTQTYQIVISRNGTDFDPANVLNRVLTGLASTGTHTVLWDGKDNNGNAFPAGTYKYEIVGRNGEIHFPMVDIEGNVNGGPTLTKLNGANAGDTTVYFDDRGYRTASGVLIGELNGKLCGSGSSAPVPAPATYSLVGVDSAAATGSGTSAKYYRNWSGSSNSNNDCSGNTQYFGDGKALDLWALEKSQVYKPEVVVVPASTTVDVGAQATMTGVVQSGGTAYGSFVFSNASTVTATGVTYAVTLGNSSVPATCPSAVNFTVRPAGVTATYSQGACAITFTGMPTTLTAAQTLSFAFNYVVLPTNPGAIPLTAKIVATNESAGMPMPNVATAQTVVAKPIVAVSKTGTGSAGVQVAIGDTITYVITANVSGAPLTAALNLSDTLGAGLTFGQIVSNSPALNCSGALNCTLPAGTAEGAYSVTYTATVNAAAKVGVNNSVVATGGGGDLPPSCTSCSVTHSLKPRLTVAKNLVSRVLESDQFTVAISGGPSRSTSTGENSVATTAFTAAAGMSYTLNEVPAGNPVANIARYQSSYTCSNTFAGGTPMPAPGTTGTSVNITPQAGDDIVCTFTNTAVLPKVTATKTVSANPLIVGATGQSYAISIAVVNGPTTAPITIADVLPTGITLSNEPTATNATLSGCPSTGSDLGASCQLPAGLSNGTYVITIPVAVSNAAVANGAANQANLGGGGDPACTSASATEACDPATPPVTVQDPIAITLNKTVVSSPLLIDIENFYELTVTLTSGSRNSSDVVVTDVVPTHMTLGSVPTGCTKALQTVTCTVTTGTLTTASPTKSYRIPVTPTKDLIGPATNTATASGGGDARCNGTGNCTSTVTTPVKKPAQVTLTKTGGATALAGSSYQYTLTLTNSGEVDTGPVLIVKEKLPAGVTVNAVSAGVNCGTPLPSTAGAELTCEVPGPVSADNGTVSFTLTTTMPSTGGRVINYASTSPTGAGNPGADPGEQCTEGTNVSCASFETQVNTPANVTLHKSAAATVLAGQTLTYTLGLGNSGGTAIAAGQTVHVSELLPVGVSNPVALAGNGLSSINCAFGSSPATCSATLSAPLAAGAANGAASFTISVTVPTTSGAITNAASVDPTGGSTPPAPGTGCAPATSCSGATTTVTPVADLSIEKTVSGNGKYLPGQPLTYTITVSNAGPSDVDDVVVSDTVPQDVTVSTWTCTASANANCDSTQAGGGTGATGTTSPISLSHVSLKNGASIVITIEGDVDLGAINTITNTATATPPSGVSCTTQPCAPSDTVTSENSGAPNLLIEKAAAPTSFAAGGTGQYIIKVHNSSAVGTSSTTGTFTVEDSMPSGITIGPVATGPDWNCSASTSTKISCTSAPGVVLLPGSAASPIVANVVVASGLTGKVSNTATVSGGGMDCSAANACTSTVPTNIDRPVLTVSKVLGSKFELGKPSNYLITVLNNGQTATLGVGTITDTIPAGLTIGDLSTLNNGACTNAGQVVTCSVPAKLATGASVNFTIPVTPDATLLNTSVVNTAKANGGFGDLTCVDDDKCVGTTDDPFSAPKLELTKRASPQVFAVGQQSKYVLTVKNLGDAATSADVVVTDSVPALLTIDAVPTPDCSVSGQLVTCTVAAPLAATVGEKSFEILVTPKAGNALNPQAIVNDAYVRGGGDPLCTASTADKDLQARCKDSVTTGVNAPQLSIVKTADPAVFDVGVQAKYVFTVSNVGTVATSGNIIVTDVIPSSLVIGTLPTAAPVNCVRAAATSNQVTCTITSSMAANAQPVIIEIPVTPGIDAWPLVTNTASVSGGGDLSCPDAKNALCQSEVKTSVSAPSLALTKRATGNWIIGTGNPGYELVVTNDASASASTVGTITVADAMPAGVTPNLSAVSADWTCTFANPMLTCESTASFVGLAPSASSSIAFPVTLDGAIVNDGDRLTNLAAVGGGGDPYNGGVPPLPGSCTAVTDLHCASATSGVNTPPAVTITKDNGSTQLTAGSETEYTVTIVNTGGLDATGLSWTDDANGMTDLSITPQASTAPNVAGTCNASGCSGITVAANGGEVRYTVRAEVIAAAGQNAVNTANLAGANCVAGTPSTPAAQCSATDSDPVITAADLTTTKKLVAVNGVSVTAGSVPVLKTDDVLTYAITVRNLGATGDVVKLTETVPQNTVYAGAGESWSSTPACAAAGSSCTQSVTMPGAAGGVAAEKVVHFTVKVLSVLRPADVVNTVLADKGACLQCSVTTPIGGVDLQVTLTTPSSVTSGEFTQVVGVCKNNGPQDGINVSCHLNGVPSDATTQCVPAQSVAVLKPGETITCTSTFTGPVDGNPLYIVSSVTNDRFDSNPLNDRDEAKLEVRSPTTGGGNGGNTGGGTPPAFPIPVDSPWAQLMLGLVILLASGPAGRRFARR
ncbi:FlgD immunoglobulin-like domain containing protein [Diaphorobacter caeni]|uniref:FlgD immunoglobulin-like domain containing protein n=1 Tax=Diaphorobacter caeni TaxID=2784387 RepID=UPI00188F4AC0|nr:FlgD immunoglobulin-like domain containing protein [Diaphorobacter caeni]MBF5003648.1 DUF11 domain-containing protein [Diaphorobacter caeni]